MPGTYTKLLYHVVFSTKHRARLITVELQPRLHEYLGGIVRGEKGMAIRIGGTADHVHLLIRWRTDESLATLMRNVKSHSSLWVHQTFPQMQEFRWQEGYGAFTVSQSQAEAVDRYIQNQVQHHRERSFEEEFIELLKVHGIEYDERYLWN
jgi:REP element-mobilizing transposase RayT